MNSCVCFVSSASRLKEFLNIYRSVRAFHPTLPIFLLYCDDPAAVALPSDITVVPRGRAIDCIGRIDIINHVVTLGYEKIVVLDNDMDLYAPLDDLYAMLEQYNAIVTPHCLAPLPNDGQQPSNESIVLAGNYNAGFFACRNTEETREFLKYWHAQTTLKPRLIPQEGHFAEQGWLRFIGDYMSGVKILRHPGYNVAYWNVHQRDLKRIDGKWKVGDATLFLYHFSGLDFAHPEKLSVHQSRHVATGQLLELHVEYIERVGR